MNSTLKTTGRVIAMGFLALTALNCAGASAGSSEDGTDESTASTEQAIGTPHCYAEIERPSPTARTLPIGTALTLRTNPNLICPGPTPEKLIYRFYVEGPGGRIAVQGATGWSASRLVPFDTTGLAPGKYKIYAYSMPASMKAAWLAEDYTAMHASKRTGYTYVTLETPVTTSWSTGDWGACTVMCGGGFQSRSVSCVDSQSVAQPDEACSATKPETTQACNTQECDPMNCGAAFGCHVSATSSRPLIVSADTLRSFKAESAHVVVPMDSVTARKWLDARE